MLTTDTSTALSRLFSELADGVAQARNGYMLNTGDIGLLASLDKLDDAWKTTAVSEAEWTEIRNGLRDECQRWLKVLQTPREIPRGEFQGLVSSIGHFAYHLGAIRQINKNVRGPKEGVV